MALSEIPSVSGLQDGQFIQITGPNGITTGYLYDEQQRALYFKESQILFPSFHGASHIAEDPIPSATCDTPGLMAADDKCKLDSLLGTRIGIVGFQGGGFPDDGGWLQGDIILAAGTEFISIERIGNVVRFTVDSPLPLNCACEECQQIFWVQDETDIASIRPPTCSGKLPGINSYGELKVYLFPESTIADPNDTEATIQNKGSFPALIFKRYDDDIVPGAAEYELILKRDASNETTTEIGWAFTPGATGIVECAWFVGKDDDGNQLRFDIEPDSTPGLMGAVLYNGHLLTKKMGVIVAYTSTVLSTNQYTMRLWNVVDAAAVGDSFTAKNVWQYLNPENPTSGSNPQQQVVDNNIDLLPIGTLVDLWAFKVGEIAGEPLLRWFFNQRPHLNPQHTWSWVGQTQFGDTLTARAEVAADAGSDDKTSSEEVSDVRTLERSMWGLDGVDDPLLWYDTVATGGTAEGDISQEHRSYVDTSLPGLRVRSSPNVTGNFSERPVRLWHRQNLKNALFHVDIGRPEDTPFVIYDVLLRAQIDETVQKFMIVQGVGTLADLHYVRVCGVNFHELPPSGTIRVLSPEDNRNRVFSYTRKFMFPTVSLQDNGNPTAAVNARCDSVILAGTAQYTGDAGDVIELLHQEYSCPVVRVVMGYDDGTEIVTVQFKVGTLDMSTAFEDDDSDDDVDDFVRGIADGYAVSAEYTQDGTFTGVGDRPEASPDSFVVYEGGEQISSEISEYWNKLDIMVRDSQVWIWWNDLLVPPSTTLSAALPSPVNISTPYFNIDSDDYRQFGKYGMRLWPGAKVRRIDLRTQLTQRSEYTLGQLEIV